MGEDKFTRTELLRFKKKEKRARGMKYPLILIEKPKDLADLLHKMVIHRRSTYYKMKNGPKLQPSGSLRSIEDMYRVVISYYPKISYKKFYEIIDDLREGKDNERNQFITAVFGYNYCGDVRKQVHFSSGLYVTEKLIRDRLGDRNIQF